MGDISAESVTPIRAQVAEELRALLGRRRMSATELARRVGATQPYIWRRMSGEIAFDLDDLQKIAVVLGVSVSDLLPPSTRASSPTLVDPLAQRVIATVGAPKRRRTQPHTPIRGNRPSPVRVRPLTPAPA
jgi:transcriptional regulator with XRE-family HTH domain